MRRRAARRPECRPLRRRPPARRSRKSLRPAGPSGDDPWSREAPGTGDEPGGVLAQPLLEQGAVHGAEVEGRTNVVVLVEPAEPRKLSERARPHGRAHHESDTP